MLKYPPLVLALASLATAAGNLPSCAARQVNSGDHPVALLELYTSEGCNSCPPADRWLSSLPASPKLQALAFHVDYWDYLGWKDRYADPAFSERQRRRAGQAGANTVYTPQAILNGQDFRPGNSALNQSLAAMARTPAAVSLSLGTQMQADKLAVTVDISGNAGAVANVVYVALYEDGLRSNVAAGENKGETLRHDKVVRRLIGPLRPDAAHRVSASLQIAPEQQLANSGVVAWLEDANTGRTLQAVGMVCAVQ